MAREQIFPIQGFSGVVSSLDPTLIPANAAQDSLNVDTDRGDIRLRGGWQEQSGDLGSDVYGLVYARGNSGSAIIEEFIAFIEASSVLKPYSVHVSTGAKTEIKDDGGSALSLTKTGDWSGISMNSLAYCFLRGGAVYRHAVGTTNSWAVVDADPPDDLTGSISVSFDTTEDLSSESAGTPMSWAGFTDGDETFDTGVGTKIDGDFNAVSAPSLILDFIHYGSGASGGLDMTLDLSNLTAGATTDFSAADFLEFDLTYDPDYQGGGIYGVNLDPGQSGNVYTLTISDGVNSQSFECTTTRRVVSYDQHIVTVRATVPDSVDMSEYDDVNSIQLTAPNGTVGLTASSPTTTEVAISAVRTAAVDPFGASTPSASGTARVRFGLANYDEERDQEATEVLGGTWYQIDDPKRWFDDAGTTFLGNVPTVSMRHGGDPATHCRLYVMFEDQNVWRLVAEVEASEATYAVDKNETQLRALPERDLKEANPVGNVNCAATYNGWMVWGHPGGRSNVRHSRVGLPRSLARASDDVEDLTRGATFTLAGDNADEPVWMGQAGAGFIILGERAAYSQYTQGYPYQLTPPAQLRGSKGVYGPNAACRFSERSGNPVVAYVDTSLGLYFVRATQVDPQGEYGFQLYEAGQSVRDEILDFLGEGSPPLASDLYVVPDERGDSLWIWYRNRGIQLTRPEVASGSRVFHKHEFTHGEGEEWEHFAADAYWGMRALRSTGAVDELLRDASSNFALITGATRDNGAAMTQPFWRSRRYRFDLPVRLLRVEIQREDMTDTPGVTVDFDRASRNLTSNSGERHMDGVWIDLAGREFDVKVTPGQDDGAVSYMVLTLAAPQDKGLLQ